MEIPTITRLYVSDGGAEYVTLWVDDEYVLGGDYYHDKIEERIEGFIYALEWSAKIFEYVTEYIEIEELNEEINLGDIDPLVKVKDDTLQAYKDRITKEIMGD